MFNSVNTIIVNDAVYQVHLRLGHEELISLKSDDTLDAEFVDTQQKLLQKMSVDTGLTTGKHLEYLWAVLRPPTVPSIDQLDGLLRLEALADRFDASIFPLRAPLDELARIRAKFQQAIRAALSGGSPIELFVNDLTTAVEALGTPSETNPGVAIFQPQFEGIHQYCTSCSNDVLQAQTAILAGRHTRDVQFPKHSLKLMASLSAITAYAAGALAQESPSALQGDLNLNLAQKMQKLHSTPLSQLGQLRTELEFLSKLLANIGDELCQDQHQILSGLLISHLDAWRTEIPDSVAFMDFDGVDEIGTGFVKYALACLIAYTPDMPFDPALKEATRRSLLTGRKDATR